MKISSFKLSTFFGDNSFLKNELNEFSWKAVEKKRSNFESEETWALKRAFVVDR